MYQLQSIIDPLNSNAPMHAPVTFSSLLVKWTLQLDLLSLTAVSLPHSQIWVTVIKEKPQSFKVTHWAILVNPKVIWKFTVTRPCWAVDMIYYILNAPLRILMGFLQNCFWFHHIFAIFNNIFGILLEPLTMHNDIGWNCTCASW